MANHTRARVSKHHDDIRENKHRAGDISAVDRGRILRRVLVVQNTTKQAEGDCFHCGVSMGAECWSAST
jgi:hypothetical protein